MAGITFYFFFSTIGLLGVLLFVGSVIYFRLTGKTILGERVERGASAYKNMKRLTGNRNLVIAIFFSVILATSLIYAVTKAISMNNSNYLSFLFIIAPAVTILTFALVIRDARRRIGKK